MGGVGGAGIRQRRRGGMVIRGAVWDTFRVERTGEFGNEGKFGEPEGE